MPPLLMNPWMLSSDKFDYEHHLASVQPRSQRDLLSPSPESYAGRRISKSFRKTLYFGTVCGFIPAIDNEDSVDLWSILYDDGDREDFEKAELVRQLRQYEQHQHQDPMNATTTTTTTTTTAASSSNRASAPVCAGLPREKKKKRPVTIDRASSISPTAVGGSMYDQVKESNKRKKTDAFVPAPLKPKSSKKQSKKKRATSPKTTTTTTTLKSATEKKKLPSSQEKKATTTTKKDKLIIDDKDSDDYKKTFEGRRVAKYFQDGVLYFGTVQEFSPARWNVDQIDLWLVLYDDTDTEHMTRTDLLQALQLYDQHKLQDNTHS